MKFKKIAQKISMPFRTQLLMIRTASKLTKEAFEGKAHLNMAYSFANKTIDEAKRAIKEKTFNHKQKKLWRKEILPKYIGKKCKLYSYAKEMVGRIQNNQVIEEDFGWMKNEMIPVFESDIKLIESKLE